MILTIPGIPPTGNHYVKHSRGRHFKTSEATKFQTDIGVLLLGDHCKAKSFRVTIIVCLGPKQKGDVDNFPKCVLDGLAKHGAFRDLKGKVVSDSLVEELTVRKTRGKIATTFVVVESARAIGAMTK